MMLLNINITMKTFKDYLAETIQINEYDTVPSGWNQFSGSGGKAVAPPKGNYQEVPSPDSTAPGTWYLLRPSPATDLPFNPVKTIWWEPVDNGGVMSPQIGDDRMGTIVNRFVDKNGKIADQGTLNQWLKSLPQSEYDAWANTSGAGSSTSPRWEYENNPKYKATNKVGSNNTDPKVKALQDRILAKDPNALPKHGADGKMGPETRTAMAKLGIKESLELQRILDLSKF